LSGKTHLVIPDSHAHPDYNNDRYDYLGKLIVDIKPDVVVDIGDWWDMPSLCSYDKGTKGFEGRRYKRDIEAGLDAQDRMFHPINKAKKRKPRFVRTLGNHERRILTAVSRDPVLEGTIGIEDLQSKEYGWEEYPFLEKVTIDGVTYSHYFVTGVSGRPISGEHPAHMLLVKNFTSSTMGHSHTFDHTTRAAANGRHLNGLVVGVYQDYHAEFAGPANDVWNAGVCICRDVEDGQYDLEHISLKRLKEEYGA
jgi:hypothetical protein